MKQNLKEFSRSLHQEVAQAKEADAFCHKADDIFTTIILEYLEEAGEVLDPVLCPYRAHGLQMNGYSISEDFETVDIYVSLFIDDTEPKSVSRTEIDACLKRGIQLFRKATNDLYESFKRDSDTYGFAHIVFKNRKSIKNVRLIALTNGVVKPIKFHDISIGGATISFSVWDVDRLYRCVNSGKMRETIELDFIELFGSSIECIENKSSDKYSVYMAILPGDYLAAVYAEYGARLLERNVRSFLQARGKVNKGIRDTIANEPDMFLAYNNGISVTAESVDIIRDENGKPAIKKIRDIQIVNGGQTTASLFNAKNDKRIQADLSNVFIQMKLSVIDDAENMDEIVPKISAYANTQNRVQIADFSANDPFHRKIEEISRVVWAPAQNGMKPRNWFYERARGQYADEVSKQTTALRRRQFREEHPMFTKTDLAKYENTWDQLPHQVSEGAQKNFKKFMIRVNERGNIKIDVQYYEHLIAKAIMFKSTEKLVQAQNYGGYRANIVTYTLAFLSHKTSQRINLNQIWKEQKLSPALESEIVEISKLAHAHIVNPPGGRNIGEWCKNVRSWSAFVQTEYSVTKELQKELISVQKPSTSDSSKSNNMGINTITDDEQKLIEEASCVPAETWFALSRWAKETNNFQTWQRSLLFSVGTIVGRNREPSFKQAKQSLKVYKEALNKGFK